MNLIEWLPIKMAGFVLVVDVMFYSCQPLVFSTACRSAALEPNLSEPAVYPLAIPVLLPVRFKRGPLPESVRVLLVGTGILELLGCLALAESGVLSVEELLSVRGRPGVDVFRGTLDPNPTGVGRIPRAPERMLDDRRTLDPRRPSASSLFNDILEPWRLGGREPGLLPGVRELRPIEADWRRP